MTTLRDLSRHLGLSITQVSRALNGHHDVSEATRDRVREAARALRYRPNLSARRLALGRSGLMALVLPGMPRVTDHGYFVQMVGGLSQRLARLGRQFVLHIASPGEDIIDVYARLIDAGSLDGFVLLEPELGDRRADFLRRQGVPFVVHGRLGDEAAHPFYDIDNAGVARTLTSLLLARGHRRVAFLNGEAGKYYAEARRQGWLSAHAAAGVVPDLDLHRTAEMTEAEGLLAGIALFGGGARPPTGIVCGSMRLAQGVMGSLAALGLAVPRDVSVVAHDDDFEGLRPSAFDPTLTVTRSPLWQAWRPLADILVAATEGQPLARLQRVGEVALVPAGSVADAGERVGEADGRR